MTPGTKISLVLAVGLVALVGGYFLLVPAGPESRAELPKSEPALAGNQDTGDSIFGEGDGWSEFEENWIDSKISTSPNSGILTDAVNASRDALNGPATFSSPQVSPGAFTVGGESDSYTGSSASSGVLTVPTADPGGPLETETPPLAANQPARLGNPGPTYELYTVKRGDSYWKIAKWWFGDEMKHDLIAQANPLIDPRKLREGQKLRLPPRDAPRPQAAPDSRTYIVQSGDSLARIARLYFREESRWQAIYEANKSIIGTNPNALQVGMKLRIPEA